MCCIAPPPQNTIRALILWIKVNIHALRIGYIAIISKILGYFVHYLGTGRLGYQLKDIGYYFRGWVTIYVGLLSDKDLPFVLSLKKDKGRMAETSWKTKEDNVRRKT